VPESLYQKLELFRSLLVEKLSQTNDNIVTLPKYTVFSR
jgi:hypothetical protein